MLASAHGNGLSTSFGSKDTKCEGTFRELLSSQLAALEEVLVTAHFKALASVRTKPDLPEEDAWRPNSKVSAPQSLEQVLVTDHLKDFDSVHTMPDLPSDAWGPTHQASAPQNQEEVLIVDNIEVVDSVHTMPEPRADAWGPESKASALEKNPRQISFEDAGRLDSLPNSAVVTFMDVVPETPARTVAFLDEVDESELQEEPDSSLLNQRHMSKASTASVLQEEPDSSRSNQRHMSKASTGPGDYGYLASEKLRADKAAYVVRSGRFELMPMWKEKKQKDNKNRGKLNLTRAPSIGHLLSLDEGGNQRIGEDEDGIVDSIEESERFMLDQPHMIEADWCLKNRLLLPNSKKRAGWDVLSLLFVAYDVVILPLGFFDLPETTFFTFMTWTTRLFWTFDIPMSCLTGYMRLDGTIEMRPKKIIQKYFCTWFPLDVVIVLTDWCELVASGFGFVRITKASRTFRIIRMIRLLRIAKIQQVIQLLVERLQSEVVHTVVEITEIMCVLLIVAHLFACLWWGIGSRDAKDTWVEEVRARRLPFSEQYALSLHWSISQFTGGMDEIQAEDVSERYFVIGAFLFCFILASLFVGSLTSSMTQLQIMANKQTRQFQKLRRFLHQNNISGKTALRIQRNAQHAVAEQQRLMPEQDVELLNMVSEPLRYELHFEIYSEIFDSHLFFHRYKEECPAVARKVCHYASSISLASRGDVMFSAGELPENPTTWIFFEGYMSYLTIQGEATYLHEQQWITEAALWTTWRHQGVLTALADCRLYTLDTNKFRAIVGQFEHLTFDPRKYAQAYIKDLNKLSAEELTDLSFHLVSPGAERAALKPKTGVYNLCKDEYNMKIASNARKANAFMVAPRVTQGGGLQLAS